MKKLLIFGASGLVGKALMEECKDSYDIYGTYATRPVDLPEEKQFQLDITDRGKMKELILSIRPDVIISCLRGDFEQQLIFHRELALEIENADSTLYFFSTANVFDGDFTKHHSEEDTPHASSPYGQFKVECEDMLQKILEERAVMIRIPQIWGKKSPRLDQIKSGIEKGSIEVFSNLECNHLTDEWLAKQLKYIIHHKLTGVFHLGAVDMMTQVSFIEELVGTLTDKEIKFQESLLQDTHDTFYFGLKSIRNDLPESLLKTNREMIADLVHVDD
ncbi:sugar nucleotide-binding protein [Rossellomorea aquimaris]|uniref:sugar nucleotide-binding protein n=1 Tax=Rossellomorea aquimaris TaxID=189382 RepID=UPI001CD73EEE|nr:sugar nucleotide-binding protein [Rossellomorea aquimaris]MCA1057516.1 sugar nucleotide-binding protein [Rossellomorea aquimaris]